MKVYLDTNVIIDATASREPWNVPAEKIILLASEDKINVVLSASAVTDIYYICNKAFRDELKTRETIKTLITLLTVTDVKKRDLQEALNLKTADFEDALVCFCAKRNNCQYIITRNIKDFENSPVPAITPQEFLDKIS